MRLSCEVFPSFPIIRAFAAISPCRQSALARTTAARHRAMLACSWVEFAKKGVAKRVAEMLNGQPMGGPKRSAYHYDLWNLKYLHKFKWDNLTEEIGEWPGCPLSEPPRNRTFLHQLLRICSEE